LVDHLEGLLRSERRRLPSSRHASTTCGCIPALARMKEATRLLTRPIECKSREPRSANSNHPVARLARGRTAVHWRCRCQDDGRRGITQQVHGGMECDGGGFDHFEASGKHLAQRRGTKELPSCMTIWRNSARPVPGEPEHFEGHSPISREAMVPMNVAKRALANWL
jgi:hypothetical protein